MGFSFKQRSTTYLQRGANGQEVGFWYKHGRLAFDGHQAMVLEIIQPGQAAQQAQGIGMLRIGIQFIDRGLLR